MSVPSGLWSRRYDSSPNRASVGPRLYQRSLPLGSALSAAAWSTWRTSRRPSARLPTFSLTTLAKDSALSW
jgi:hypothetical protein